MLVELSIENLGVLPAATAQWAPGLTVLTGETGAGKTFLVSGLRLISGGRADSSRVREGSDRAYVEGIFSLSELDESVAERIRGIIAEAGGDIDEDEVIVSRSLSAKGRSRAHVGGRTVTAGVMAQIVEPLLTVHGQHDQLRLLSTEQQLEALDSVDPAIAGLKKTYQSNREQWRTLTQELKRRQENRREMAQEEDRLRFALDEIAALDPQPGEDKELVDQVKRLQDTDALRAAATQAYAALDSAFADDESSAALDRLTEAEGALAHASDGQLRALAAQLTGAIDTVADISAEVGRYVEQLSSDPAELDRALRRQADLAQLTRKYADDIDGVLAWQAAALERLAGLDTSTEAIEELTQKAQQAGEKTRAAAEALSAARRSAAQWLEETVTQEIRGLAMPTASLEVALSTTSAFRRQGVDEVEFRLKAHDTAPARPLNQAASGGELSRIMLALEVVLSADRRGTTIVFDEVDAGVGGRAAIEIGRRLMVLSRWCQVIVVTHLPQVAAYADHHLVVTKSVAGEEEKSVVSAVRAVSDEERVEELARMLAGLDDTETGRAHAQELLDRATAERSSASTASTASDRGGATSSGAGKAATAAKAQRPRTRKKNST